MPAATIKEVIDKLDALLDRWEPIGDHRAVFVRSYRIITIEMDQAIAAGEFEDGDWMARLDVNFAQEYFDVLAAYKSGEPSIPECWKLAFDLSLSKRGTVLQDLALGMVAHIIHDLPIALFKTGIEGENRQGRHRDHIKTNDILGRSIDDVQTEISSHYSVVLGYLDRITGRIDEILTDKGIGAARDGAWTHAIELADAPNQSNRDDTLQKIGQKALDAAQLLAPKPPPLLARVIPLIRRWDRTLAHWL